jgi:hypothetical protein
VVAGGGAQIAGTYPDVTVTQTRPVWDTLVAAWQIIGVAVTALLVLGFIVLL